MDLYFGIDIASETFTAYDEDREWSEWPNDKKGVRAFLKTLPAGAVLGVESTGGYGKLLADAAWEKGLTVYLLQPAKVKSLRKAAPERGKSDKLDSREIHEYVKVFKDRLHPYEPLPAFEAELRKLHRVRSGLVDKIASIRLMLTSLGDDAETIEATVAGAVQRAEKLKRQMDALIRKASDAKVLATIPGVKTCTIAALLPALRTVPFKSKDALVCYFGLDLRLHESGKFKGKRKLTKQGDKHARRALFLAALSAVRTKAWKPYYQRMLGQGKREKMKALVALARKILHTIYGVYRTQTAFVAPNLG